MFLLTVAYCKESALAKLLNGSLMRLLEEKHHKLHAPNEGCIGVPRSELSFGAIHNSSNLHITEMRFKPREDVNVRAGVIAYVNEESIGSVHRQTLLEISFVPLIQ